MGLNKILITIGLLFFLVSSTVFTVSETERAIKFRLGEVIKTDFKPGIHFKLPFINNIKKFDSRILTMDSKPERFLTSEKKNVIVDSFVKWKVADVKVFYTAVAGDVAQANIRLDQIIKDAFRSEFSRRNIKQLVSSDRNAIRTALISRSSAVALRLGMEIVDVQVKRIDLPSDVSSSVYRRMEAERERVAREFRSQGKEAAERIKANADKQREIIMANAFRDAEVLRGNGDAAAADTYAKSYGADIEFFSFYRSMSAYKQSFKSAGDMLVVEPDSDFFKYFKKQK
ncbi:MAG: protease modulator HflC [Methylococcales bacterium]|nr:protease modulator HflC [Methylococcales bacterium]